MSNRPLAHQRYRMPYHRLQTVEEVSKAPETPLRQYKLWWNENLTVAFSPDICTSMSCLQTGQWYWLGTAGAKTSLSVTQMSGVSSIISNEKSGCLRLRPDGTNIWSFDDRPCTDMFTIICETEDGKCYTLYPVLIKPTWHNGLCSSGQRKGSIRRLLCSIGPSSVGL